MLRVHAKLHGIRTWDPDPVNPVSAGKGQDLLKSNTAMGAAISYFLTLSALLRHRSVPKRWPILIINN